MEKQKKTIKRTSDGDGPSSTKKLKLPPQKFLTFKDYDATLNKSKVLEWSDTPSVVVHNV